MAAPEGAATTQLPAHKPLVPMPNTIASGCSCSVEGLPQASSSSTLLNSATLPRPQGVILIRLEPESFYSFDNGTGRTT
ncbi:MAG: hypothetical protein IH955_07535 [Chloroflexi bacterium]|nr:hypothetical protein [Chloroflexota bacterium]